MSLFAAIVKASAQTARAGVNGYANQVAAKKAPRGKGDGPGKCTPCAAVRRKASGYAAANRAFGRGE